MITTAMDKYKWEKLYNFASMAGIFALSVFVCLFFYQYDNKYMVSGARGANGVINLDEESLKQSPVVFLVEGWEYYGGQLLTPEDFAVHAPTPDEYIFIGQYGGFDAGKPDAPPHGSASYRLTVLTPDEPKTYMLELPEIFTSYHAYVNGRLVQTLGDPSPASYFPETGNRIVNIEAGGSIDILIAVSDFSHLYSGLTYPPAFGEPDAVYGLLLARLIFRSILLSFALAIGALALLIGSAVKKTIDAFLFGLLCLFFIGYAGYPVFQTLTANFYPFYTVESFSFCAMLLIVVLLQRNVYGKIANRDWLFIGFGALMCVISAILPFALTSGKLWVMGGYSFLIVAYEWSVAAYLTFASVRAALRGLHSKTLLGGILIFDASLIMDRLLPFHEPIITGWFPELASFALVLCVGFAVAVEIAEKYRDSAILEERMNSMERLSKMQQMSFQLLNERIEETKTAHHDLRHHFVVIEGFLQNKEYENLETYVQRFKESVQRVNPTGFSKNPVVNVLMQHYAILAEREKVSLTMKLEIEQNIKASEADLCAVLSNLLENALEACRRQKGGKRFIRLSMGQKPSMLSIRMENSTDKAAKHGVAFLSLKAENRKGHGLESVKSIAARYSGDTEFKYDNESGVFVSTVLMML